MRRRALGWALLASIGFVANLNADLKKAMAEPNLEKRSGLALDNAEDVLKAARAAYAKGQTADLGANIEEIQQSVDLAYDSLVQTGKNPRKSPRWFKRAEIRTRNLGRQLDNFRLEMSYTERPMLDKLRARVQKVHDDLLMGLMEGKRK